MQKKFFYIMVVLYLGYWIAWYNSFQENVELRRENSDLFIENIELKREISELESENLRYIFMIRYRDMNASENAT